MTTGINLLAIYIANGLGILLLVITLIENIWRLREPVKENRFIFALIIIVLVSCIIDCMNFASDGKPGIVNAMIVYGGNFLLYTAGIVAIIIWTKFIELHMKFSLPRWYWTIIGVLAFVGAVMLIVNFFTPIVFGLSASNQYYRGAMASYYFIVEITIMLFSVILYIIARRKSGQLKLFPMWAFVLPVLLGVIVQSVFYGISLVWPCMAVGVGGVMISLQNEMILRDKLTGLYNRFYLDQVKEWSRRRKNTSYIAIMLDLNDFKGINDTYGHQIGDEALIDAADILTSAVANSGIVLRYAGDEFVIVLNATDDESAESMVKQIKDAFEMFNVDSSKLYKLSCSAGWAKMDLSAQSVDDVINVVDKRMYEDKRAYYIQNDRRKH